MTLEAILFGAIFGGAILTALGWAILGARAAIKASESVLTGFSVLLVRFVMVSWALVMVLGLFFMVRDSFIR